MRPPNGCKLSFRLRPLLPPLALAVGQTRQVGVEWAVEQGVVWGSAVEVEVEVAWLAARAAAAANFFSRWLRPIGMR